MKAIMFFLILFNLLFSSSDNTVYASSKNYAQVLYSNVYLYKTASADSSLENVHFILERSYFIELLSADGDFFLAKYLQTEGYVSKNQVQCVRGTPNNPFLLGVSMRIYGEESRRLSTIPTTVGGESTKIMLLPKFTRDVVYIAKCYGETLIPERTNIWYYVKYTDETAHYGYIYSDGTDQMSAIAPNIETLPYIDHPSFEINGPISIPASTKNVIIILLSIPALLFVFMILRGSSILYSTAENSKKKSKEIKDFKFN